MLVLEFPLCSSLNKLSKAHRALWVFQLNIRGGSASDPLSGGGRYRSGIRAIILRPIGLMCACVWSIACYDEHTCLHECVYVLN